MKLYISGGNHFYTDVEDRIKNIENEIGAPDAVFWRVGYQTTQIKDV